MDGRIDNDDGRKNCWPYKPTNPYKMRPAMVIPSFPKKIIKKEKRIRIRKKACKLTLIIVVSSKV